MGLFTLFFLAILTPAAQASSNHDWAARWRSVDELTAILRSVPAGRAVLEKATERDPQFLAGVKVGQASFTESTFSRTYSLLDGKERIVLRHEVTLNRELSLADAVVDLAHELVHFTEKGMLDPYRPGFELEEFIRNGIEGGGGELAALKVECQVAWALEKSQPGYPTHRLCDRYRNRKNVFPEDAARRDYYALGTWYRKAPQRLKEAIPELSDKQTLFTSSYAGKPYPLALAEEFDVTRRAACLNNRRKYRLIASQSGDDRAPAAVSLGEERERLRDYDRTYCRSVREEKAVPGRR